MLKHLRLCWKKNNLFFEFNPEFIINFLLKSTGKKPDILRGSIPLINNEICVP